MPPPGFEPTISAGERPQTYALDHAATGTGSYVHIRKNNPIKYQDVQINTYITTSQTIQSKAETHTELYQQNAYNFPLLNISKYYYYI